MIVFNKILLIGLVFVLLLLAARAFLGSHFYYRYRLQRKSAISIEGSFSTLEGNLKRALVFSKNPLIYKELARINLENNFGKLPEDVKVLYKRIAKSRGKAVCLIADNTYTGCFANLPHQFLNELKQRNKVLVCGNCGRILVYSSSEK